MTGLQFTVQVGTLPAETFTVLSFELDEQLSHRPLDGYQQWCGPFQLCIELASPRSDVDVNTVLDHPCEMVVWFDGLVQRRISGVVSAFEHRDTGFRRSRYQMEVRPALWRLSLRRNCRIFQQQTPVEIISAMLHEMNIIDYAFTLRHDHPVREYCVQYSESDYDFVIRLAAEEGMFIYHEFEQGSHLLVFADDACTLADIPVILPYILRTQALSYGAAVQGFSYAEVLPPSHLARNDYNFNLPNDGMLQQRASDEQLHHYETYKHVNYPDRYQQDDIGKTFTDYLLDSLRAYATTGSGKSNCAALASGQRFTLKEHPSGTLNRNWLLVTVHHEGKQPQAQALEEEGASEPTTYHNTFSVIDAHLTWCNVPSRPPRITGPLSALVVGPAGEEIYCDTYGRIKVQFPWDRDINTDEHRTCWLEVSRQWADCQYGSVALPRVGHEVIVSFQEGDPNRPIVTGVVM
jgi:type VI secretion system secreted protein VgrG